MGGTPARSGQGYPGQVQIGGTLARSRCGGTQPGPDVGTQARSRHGGYLARDGVPPIQRRVTPCPEMGYPHPGLGYAPVQGWGTSLG